MKYEVRLSKRANRELSSLEQSTRSRIVERLRELRDDPFPRGAVKLKGREMLIESESAIIGSSTRSFARRRCARGQD